YPMSSSSLQTMVANQQQQPPATAAASTGGNIPVLCPSRHGVAEADLVVKMVKDYRRKSVEDIEREVLITMMSLSDLEARQYEIHCVPKRLSPSLVNFDLLNAPEARKFTDMVQVCVTVPLTQQTLPYIGSQPDSESFTDFPFLMVVPKRALFAQNMAKSLSHFASEPTNAEVSSALNSLLETKRTFYKPASRQKVTRPILYDGQVAEELIREGVLDVLLNGLADRRLDNQPRLQQQLVRVLACLMRYALFDGAAGDGTGLGGVDDNEAEDSAGSGATAAQQAVASVGSKRGLFSWYLIKEQCIRSVVNILFMTRKDGEVVRACLKVLLRFAQHNPGRQNFVLDSIQLSNLVELIKLHGSNVRVVIGAVGIIAHVLACTQSAEFENLLIQLDSFQLKPMLAKACAELSQEAAFPRLESQLHLLLRLFLRPQQREALVPVDQRNQREIDGICSALALAASCVTAASNSGSSSHSSTADKRQSSSTPSSGSSSAADAGFAPADPATFMSEFAAETPPGLLALRQLDYLVRVRNQELREIFQQQQLHHSSGPAAELPMASAAVALTKILLRVLCGFNGSQADADSSQQQLMSLAAVPPPLAEFPPLLLTLPNVFSDCFVACMRTFQRTWTESRANREDLGTVTAVVEEQLRMALKQRPDTADKLRRELDRVTYEDVKARWQSSLSSGDNGALVYLTAQLQSPVSDLIARQRLAYMRRGSEFNRLVRPSSKKFYSQRIHLSLSANSKYLMFRLPDSDLQSQQPQHQYSSTVHKVPIQHLARVDIGRDTVGVTDSRQLKLLSDYAIQLLYRGEPNDFGDQTAEAAAQQQQQQQQQQLQLQQIENQLETEISCLLHTDDAEVFHHWSDGLNRLNGGPMRSPLYRQQLDGFVRLELEARLVVLAQAGVSPAALAATPQPTVCEPPDNYNFA
ncbi:hypothetical protein BOX15_Mlig006479g1, partial [Macrostomum lignano]